MWKIFLYILYLKRYLLRVKLMAYTLHISCVVLIINLHKPLGNDNTR